MQISDKEFEGMLGFARRLVQTPSPMLSEGKVADLVEDEMKRLGYNQVQRDEVGNVLGIMEGRTEKPTFMLNGHMDHVEAVDADKWEHGPFEGYVDDEYLYGRGSADMKAGLAVMIHCGALIKSWIPNYAGRIVVAAVVLEESGGGAGTQHILHEIRPDVAIVGEPTGNKLIIGHRGTGEFMAVVRGKSCHASVPEEGVNPLFAMAEFIRRVGELEMPSDELLGKATLVPTKLQSDQPCTNVVPSEIRLWLDWRSVPGQERDYLVNELNAILSECMTERTSGEVALAKLTGKYYTGKELSQEACMSCFKIDSRHPLVRTAQKALSKVLGERIEPSVVTYASDAAILAEHGVPTLIFGPGEPSMAHVRDERIELAQMRQAAKGYLGLLAELGK